MGSRPLFTTALIASALASALCAPAQAAPTTKKAEKPGHFCFWPSEVDGFQAVDDRTINVRVGVKDVYQLTLFSPALDIDWTQRIGIQSWGGGSICSGLDATVIVPGPIGPQKYPVTDIHKLTPEEIAATPRKDRP
jgi:hypothetical protein